MPEIVSINFYNPNNLETKITSNEGINEYNVEGWNNVCESDSTLKDKNGIDSNIGIVLTKPNNMGNDINSTTAYTGKPIYGYINKGTTNEKARVKLTNLQQYFTNGYHILVYLSGASKNHGTSITVNLSLIHI